MLFGLLERYFDGAYTTSPGSTRPARRTRTSACASPDYPTIQDYVGEAIIDTNGCRSFDFMMAQAMDNVTNNCDWSIHKDLKALPRAQYLSWMWQVKFAAAKNVTHVTDKMLHACGGTAYKPRPLEIEALSA